MNDKDLEKLVFGMAHQIRNPCAIILANANLLLQNAQLKPEGRRSVEAIVNGVHYLEDRLDEFVEFSKPLHLDLKELSVAQLLHESVALVKDKCAVKKTRIVCDAEDSLPRARLDQEQILMAVLNVVLNAIESIREGGLVCVSAKAAEGKIRIEVTDTGSGIHPRDLPEVFSPFYSTKQGGIGIGLAVSKRIVEAHGGGISVASKQKAGTRVTIDLPLSPPSHSKEG